MIILVINAGSSSVKFTCFDMSTEQKDVLASGLIERIGMEGTRLKYENNKGVEFKKEVSIPDAKAAVKQISHDLVDPDHGVLKSLEQVKAIGHRVVHGGEKITNPVIINDSVKEIIHDCFDIAPLHNPPNLIGIEACEAVFPGVPNVGIFDTAFHSTMPARAYLYGLPYDVYTDYKIRRYGFHGTSHAYVSRKAAQMLGAKPEDVKIIVCHIGNGASISAVDGGKSIDTSMGLTPLEGLIMGTRCGDMDPAIVWELMRLKNLDERGIDDYLNKHSGMLGMAGINSSDMRDIETEHENGNERCTVAVEAYSYRIKKYIGAYIAAMGGLDMLVFTAGVGENSYIVREMATRGLGCFGLKLDIDKNNERSKQARFINAEGSRVKIAVIPTDEEQEIATQTLAMVTQK